MKILWTCKPSLGAILAVLTLQSDQDEDDEPDAENDDNNEDDVAEDKPEVKASEPQPTDKPDGDVKMSDDTKGEPMEPTKEPEPSAQPQETAASAEPAKEPEQPQEDSAPNATSSEPGQTKLDDFTEKKDDPEPAKPSENEPQASGALQPEPQTAAAPTQAEKPTESNQPSNATQQEAPPQEEKKEAQPSIADYQQTNGQQNNDQPAEKSSEAKPDESTPKTTNGDAVEEKARDGDVPSSILEKGIVYFFFRARVNVSDPQDVNDIARSYMILRPLPKGAKLGDGPIGDESNCRLIAIPKKVLPLSGKDRFMVFVESSKQSFKDLKSSFLSASDYATKTQGTSHSPPATPIAEGVYAITTTGRESHFAYMTTLPGSLGEVQKDVGIKEQGSFVVSAKNPKHPGPANATLQQQPEYPQSIIDKFRDLRWMPLEPELLDYKNTQFLLIGESGGIDSALEQLPRDEKKGFDEPKEEMERLEGEDEIRVKHLKGQFPNAFVALIRLWLISNSMLTESLGDDAVFADLGTSKRDYPALLTTWDS